MLKMTALIFLFISAFTAGTIVGSHFKDQIDHKSEELAKRIDEVKAERIIKGTLPEKLKQIAEEDDDIREKYKPKKVRRKKVAQSSSSRKKKTLEEFFDEIDGNTSRKKRRPSRKSLPQKSSSQYTVQVASFSVLAQAEAMAQKLQNNGQDAIVFSAIVKGRTWHRVGIGRFSSIGEANKMQRKLVLEKIARDSIISKIN